MVKTQTERHVRRPVVWTNQWQVWVFFSFEVRHGCNLSHRALGILLSSLATYFSWFYLTLFNTSGGFGHSKICFPHYLLCYKVNILPPDKLILLTAVWKRCEENGGVRKMVSTKQWVKSALSGGKTFTLYHKRQFWNNFCCVQTCH